MPVYSYVLLYQSDIARLSLYVMVDVHHIIDRNRSLTSEDEAHSLCTTTTITTILLTSYMISLFSLVATWLVSSANESVWTDPARTSTGFNQPNLVINPNELLPGTEYTFTLSIGFIGSAVKNLFSFKKTTGTTPYGGECSVL